MLDVERLAPDRADVHVCDVGRAGPAEAEVAVALAVEVDGACCCEGDEEGWERRCVGCITNEVTGQDSESWLWCLR